MNQQQYLTPQEIEELIIIMEAINKEGKSIFLITHKIKEIQAVADRCNCYPSWKCHWNSRDW